MMNRIIVLITVLLLSANLRLSAQKVNEYPKEHLATINHGNGPGRTGWRDRASGGAPWGPRVWTIGPDSLAYLGDTWNKRINVYNREFNYRKEIPVEIWGHRLRVDSKGYLIASGSSGTIAKYDSKGKVIFAVEGGRSLEPVGGGDYFPHQNIVYFYYNNSQIGAITEEGKILSTEEAVKLLLQHNREAMQQGRFDPSLLSPPVREAIEGMKTSGKYVIIGDQLMSMDIEKWREFMRTISPQSYRNKPDPIENWMEDWYVRVIGFDREHNMYLQIEARRGAWPRRTGIIVLCKYGSFLDSFYYHDLYLSRETHHYLVPAVAPNGDVYFMRSDPKGTHFYRARNRWAPVEEGWDTRSSVDLISLARRGLPAQGDVKVEIAIRQLSKNDLRLLRNTLFALHGYRFQNLSLRKFFSKFEWYRPDPKMPNSIEILTPEQRRLFSFMRELEEK